MSEITLREHLKKASRAQHAKYSSEDYRRWARRSYEKRTEGMTKEQISEYFRKIRSGQKAHYKPILDNPQEV